MLQSSGKVKTVALWSKNKEDLTKQLAELKTELGVLRVQKIAGGSSSKLTKMCVILSKTSSTLPITRKTHEHQN
jgi:large subunit ribosomal protein L35e